MSSAQDQIMSGAEKPEEIDEEEAEEQKDFKENKFQVDLHLNEADIPAGA